MSKVIILVIKIYQYIAPKRIREACRFTPSCSEYMILAVKKYGVISGIKKGLGRLKRCRFPNGGIDYP